MPKGRICLSVHSSVVGGDLSEATTIFLLVFGSVLATYLYNAYHLLFSSLVVFIFSFHFISQILTYLLPKQGNTDSVLP